MLKKKQGTCNSSSNGSLVGTTGNYTTPDTGRSYKVSSYCYCVRAFCWLISTFSLQHVWPPLCHCPSSLQLFWSQKGPKNYRQHVIISGMSPAKNKSPKNNQILFHYTYTAAVEIAHSGVARRTKMAVLVWRWERRWRGGSFLKHNGNGVFMWSAETVRRL